MIIHKTALSLIFSDNIILVYIVFWDYLEIMEIGASKIRMLIPLVSLGTIVPVYAQQDKPNVIIIHTDEQNFRTLGCYREYLDPGQAFPWGKDNNVETPNIDELAKHGVLFNRCYATTPVSGPSRSSFLSGLYPQHSGVVTNDMALDTRAVTFAEILRENGYVTGYIGKLHLNGDGKPEWHPTRDFGFTDNRYMFNRGHWKMIVDSPQGARFEMDAPVKSTDSLSFTTDYLTNRTMDFIRQNRDTVFCCMLSIPDPHSANVVRSPYNRMYRHMNIQTPVSAMMDTTGRPAWAHGNRIPADRMEDMAGYFGMIRCIDDNVGRILMVLRENGILEKTILVFTSDHGDMCGQHGLINKGVPYDDAARVAFIVSYPGGMPEGICVDHVVSVVDFTPSLLSFLNIKTQEEFDGRDLAALWKGKALPRKYKDVVFMRARTAPLKRDGAIVSLLAGRFEWMAAVTPDYKLVYSVNPSDKPCLFDLRRDPGELVNCFEDADYKKVVRMMTRELVDYGKKYDDPRMKIEKIVCETNQVLRK